MKKHEERRRRIVEKPELDNAGPGQRRTKAAYKEAMQSRIRARREQAAKKK